jgi:hypothetical protein
MIDSDQTCAESGLPVAVCRFTQAMCECDDVHVPKTAFEHPHTCPFQSPDVVAMCAQTCGFATCSGKPLPVNRYLTLEDVPPWACTHWLADHFCGVQIARRYLAGWRCAEHQPAALNGRTVPVPDPRLSMDGLRRG